MNVGAEDCENVDVDVEEETFGKQGDKTQPLASGGPMPYGSMVR